jgi:hypothetical protein
MKRAHHFETAFCEDPECGLHLFACEEGGRRICEIVMSAQTTVELMKVCKKFLYDKATERLN